MGMGEIEHKGTEVTFQGGGSIPYIDQEGVCPGVCICQILLNCAFKMCSFYCMQSISQ